MITPDLRSRVQKILVEFEHDACQRPLYEEIRLEEKRGELSRVPNSDGGQMGSGKKKRLRIESNDTVSRTWTEILDDAAALAAAMTHQEFGKVSRFALILFLGHLLPNLTGSEDLCRRQTEIEEVKGSIQDNERMGPIESLGIDELLESCSRCHSSQSRGNVDSCDDEQIKKSFRNFLCLGLGPFLGSRSILEVDLLHVMAMAVSPLSSMDVSAHNFQIDYSARSLVVRTLQDHLALPELDAVAQQKQQNKKSLTGAFDHLRTSLKNFATRALSQSDEISAYHVLTKIAISSGREQVVIGELNTLVSMLSRNGVGCSCEHERDLLRNHDAHSPHLKCPNKEYCNLIKELIMKYNGCRHYADGSFTRKALSSLTHAITCCAEGLGSVNREKRRLCQLSSLLECAKVLFYFLLVADKSSPSETGSDISDKFADADADGIVESDGGQKEEERHKDVLLKCAIRCIGLGSPLLAKSSSSLIAMAFSYGGKSTTAVYIESLFTNICRALQFQQHLNLKNQLVSHLQAVVSVTSRQSQKFSESLLLHIFKLNRESYQSSDGVVPSHSKVNISCLASTIVLSQPAAVLRHIEDLVQMDEGGTESSNVIAMLLHCRLAYCFLSSETLSSIHTKALALIQPVANKVMLLKLMQHAFVTANFEIARSICDARLLNEPVSEKSYLWLKALSKIAAAEAVVAVKGTTGIIEALPTFCLAQCHINTIASTLCTPSVSFVFQQETLALRIEFLRLIVATCGLCSEVQMTNRVCSKHTRSHLLQTNVFQCFYALAFRYERLYRIYGIFSCEQTRSSMRTLFAVCRFLGSTAAKLFGEAVSSGNRLLQHNLDTSIPWPAGDSFHPIVVAMGRFDKGAMKEIGENPEPSIRVTVFMELMDILLKCPWPMPRAFFSPVGLPLADMRILSNPEETNCSTCGADAIGSGEGEAEVVSVLPGLPCTIFISGQIPTQYFSRAKLYFSQIVAWYTITYDGPLASDDEPLEEDQYEDPGTDEKAESARCNNLGGESKTPVASSMLPNGKFLFPVDFCPIRREGYYIVSVKLGCRDVRFGEWEVPTPHNAGRIFLRVSMQSDESNGNI